MDRGIKNIVAFAESWFRTNVLTWSMAAQWACAGLALFLASMVRSFLRTRIDRWFAGRVSEEFAPVVRSALGDAGAGAAFVGLVQLCVVVFQALGMPPHLFPALTKLAVAWVVIRLLTSIMPNRHLARTLGLLVLAAAALSIFGALIPITKFLTSLSFTVGQVKITALGVIKGVFLAVVFIQAASLASGFFARRIQRSDSLSPSLQVLTIKTVKVALFTAAVLVTMSAIGVDLTSLAIFSSALGVGIGFGLQTIFSNYIAGLLLLMDRSIKPGDTIEVGGVFGSVRGMYGRYTSILTRDGKEYLIPNETLITGEVINWTFSDSNVRIKIPVGISYGSDVELALKILEQAGQSVRRVLKRPAPIAQLMEFGDSSVNLELRAWIADADQGVTNVKSDVLRNVWRLYHEHGVEFPFPQRDVLLKPDSRLAVTIERAPKGDKGDGKDGMDSGEDR